MDFLVDLDETTKVEVVNFYNRMNNNQYTKTLLRVPKASFCKTLERFSAALTNDAMEKYSNIPMKNACPMKKVYYTNH